MYKIDWTLLKKAILGEISTKERGILQDWLNESKEHRLFYTKCHKFLKENKSLPVDVDKNFRRFIKTTEMKKHINFSYFERYVAVIVLFLGIMGLIWLLSNHNVALVNHNTVIVAGTHKALLYTGCGNPLVLEKEIDKQILSTEYFNLRQEQNMVNYDVKKRNIGNIENHTLKVPHGGEFNIRLSDGTQVFVNSETELKYPVLFTGDERRVILSGEAYFKVVKSEKPFIIVVNGMDIKVLGTEFNIRAYQDEDCYQTTLVNGQVEVAVGSDKLLLEPGEQAVLKSGTFLSKRSVDVSKYTAWRDGYVAFEDESLSSLMQKLAKWYNINVFYSRPVLKDIRFTGYINRYGDIRILLNKIEKLEVVRFEIKGNCITVVDK